MPAATPAAVSTSPSSTKSTSASTLTVGKDRWKSRATCQCVVAGRPSRRPTAARAYEALQKDTIRVPGLILRRAAATGSGSSSPAIPRSKLRVGVITTVSAVSRASGPCSAATVKPESGTHRPSVHRADDDVVERLSTVVQRVAEDPGRDAQLEGVRTVERDDRHTVRCPLRCHGRILSHDGQTASTVAARTAALLA
ncbi:hypothetical protein SALBM135S_07061 [Streptomyces alboniger]